MPKWLRRFYSERTMTRFYGEKKHIKRNSWSLWSPKKSYKVTSSPLAGHRTVAVAQKAFTSSLPSFDSPPEKTERKRNESVNRRQHASCVTNTSKLHTEVTSECWVSHCPHLFPVSFISDHLLLIPLWLVSPLRTLWSFWNSAAECEGRVQNVVMRNHATP